MAVACVSGLINGRAWQIYVFKAERVPWSRDMV